MSRETSPLVDFDRYMYRRIGAKIRKNGETLAHVQSKARRISEWTEGKYNRKSIEWNGTIFSESMVWLFDRDVEILPGVEDSPYGLPGDGLLMWRCFIVDDPIMGEFPYLYCAILDNFKYNDYSSYGVLVRHVFPLCIPGYWPALESSLIYHSIINLSAVNEIKEEW